MNSKSLFGGPGEGEKYFYNFWSKNIPSLFMKATFSGQGCILRKKASLVPGTHHVLWVCTSGIPSALRLPSSRLLPFCQTLDSMPLLQEYSTEKARMLADQVDKPASMLQPNDQYLLIINDAGCYSAQYSV